MSEKPVQSDTSVRLSIAEIFADPKFNTRKDTEEEIGKFSETLKKEGMLSPILVHPYKGKKDSPYKYELSMGFRRLAAAKLLKWETIEAKILPEAPNEAERKVLNLVENMQRKDLAPHEFAEACYALVEGGMKGPEIAKRVGVSTPHVNNMVRLRRELHPDLWNLFCKVREGVRTGNEVNLTWLLNVAALPHPEQLEKLKERMGSEGTQGTGGGGGGGGGGGEGDGEPVKRAPTRKAIDNYLQALKTVPKAERADSHDAVVKAIKWARGLSNAMPIKVKPQAEPEPAKKPAKKAAE